MVKKLVLLVFSICFILLAYELRIRYRFQAWPFESVLYVPDYLTTRDTTLRWRFSPDLPPFITPRSRKLIPVMLGACVSDF